MKGSEWCNALKLGIASVLPGGDIKLGASEVQEITAAAASNLTLLIPPPPSGVSAGGAASRPSRERPRLSEFNLANYLLVCV